MLSRILLLLLCLNISNLALAVPLKGHKMMVATPTPLSAQVAEKLIAKKGNVVDVAVGIALTLAVTNPRHASLGGGGFAMVKMGKDPVTALDFRETAPAKTHEKYYLDKDKKSSVLGPHAVGVPGIPAGLWALHKKYGKLHWSVLFDVPIRLAEKGHPISGENVQRLAGSYKEFTPLAKKYLLKNGKEIFKPGETWKQKSLASALKLMRNRGIAPFYDGPIGDDIIKTVQAAGGALTRQDFKDYKVQWRKPIESHYLGYKLYLMPPPSSGGLMIASSLNILEVLNTHKLPALSTEEFHHLIEVMKINFRLRDLLGDPAFVKNPVDLFLSKEEPKKWAKKIKSDEVLKLEPLGEKGVESDETTHFSVLDSEGNSVAMTITLNGTFGSKMASEKYGITLNNEMDDFTTRPGEANLFGLIQGNANTVAPGKRPLSSMSPTLVEKDNKVMLALGAPGGPRIITGVLQSLYRHLGQKFPIEEAISAPRVHHQFRPDIVFIDERRFAPLSIEALEELGHKTQIGWSSRVNAVLLNPDGILEATFDYRSEGGAGGL